MYYYYFHYACSSAGTPKKLSVSHGTLTSSKWKVMDKIQCTFLLPLSLKFHYLVDDGLHRLLALIRLDNMIQSEEAKAGLPRKLGDIHYRVYSGMPDTLRRDW